MRLKILAISCALLVTSFVALCYELRDTSPFYMFRPAMRVSKTLETIRNARPKRVRITCEDAVWLFAAQSFVIEERFKKVNGQLPPAERSRLYYRLTVNDRSKTKLEIDKWYLDVSRALRRNYTNPREQMNFISRDYYKILKLAMSLNLNFTTPEAAEQNLNENFCAEASLNGF